MKGHDLPAEGGIRRERTIDRGKTMKATDILQEEHRVILRVLQCLSAAADRAEKEAGLDVESIPKMLEFFRGFADRCHHGKEEAHFFPAARQRGVGCAPASLDSLSRTRRRPRPHPSHGGVPGGSGARRQSSHGPFPPACAAVRAAFDRHIGKEDHCLFPTADTLLSTADQEALAKAFEEVEQQEMGRGRISALTHWPTNFVRNGTCPFRSIPLIPAVAVTPSTKRF